MTERTIEVPGTDDRIVLSDHSADDLGEGNLFRLRRDGSEAWRLRPPGGGHDFWTEVQMEVNVLVAHSWSGYLVRLDIDSGRERDREFTK